MQITIDTYLPEFFGLLTIIFFVGLIFLYFKFPIIIAYIFTGVLVGPDVLGIVTDVDAVKLLGSIGVVLLLFLLGMEIPLTKFAKNWKLFVFGTILQVLGSLLVITLIGYWLNWPTARIVLLGFVISLSSTSIVINLLKDKKEIDTPVGTSVIGISLTQDLIIVPMMIIISLFDQKHSFDHVLLFKQSLFTIAIIGLIIYLVRSKKFTLPFSRFFQENEDMELFFSFLLCFGLGLITYSAGLSTAMGAFLAGLVVNAAHQSHWVKKRTEPFRIVFMAIFFISIGIIMDLQFIVINSGILILLTVIIFVVNTLLNALILLFWKRPISECLYGGALLAQIGEFSFILAAIGFEAHIINNFTYQTTISLISITLMLSPVWINFIRKAFTEKKSLHYLS